jgi:hypothetical protein
MSNLVPRKNVPSSIGREMSILDMSVDMAIAAYEGIQNGAIETKQAGVMLGSARTLQGAARISIQSRSLAGKLAQQEAKLVEGRAS